MAYAEPSSYWICHSNRVVNQYFDGVSGYAMCESISALDVHSRQNYYDYGRGSGHTHCQALLTLIHVFNAARASDRCLFLHSSTLLLMPLMHLPVATSYIHTHCC
jgi:hypothetical protein